MHLWKLALLSIVVKMSWGIDWQGNWAYGCDFKEGDLGNVQVPADQCGPRCASTNSCTHFSWTDYKSGTCWMKTGGATKNDAQANGNNHMICGVVGRTNGASSQLISWQGNWAYGCDFYHRDFGYALLPADQCGPTCALTNGCTHFSWTDYYGGTCWMKTGGASKDDAYANGNNNMICGIVDRNSESRSHRISWQGNWAFGCDFPGGDINSVNVPPNKCGLACESTNRCTHYSYYGHTCWLKSGGATKSDARANGNTNTFCGVVERRSVNVILWQGNWAFGCDFHFGCDIASAKVPADKCSSTCGSTNGCTHFSWTDYNGGTCWMKSGGGTKNNAHATGSNKTACGIVEGVRGMCGHSPLAAQRIVGGNETRPGAWPWMVSLQVDHQHYCGGALIDNEWVLSAAHCFNGEVAKQLVVVLGAHTTRANEGVEQSVAASEIILHGDYNKSTHANDIALVKLSRPVTYTSRIKPLCLPSAAAESFDELRCTVAGWGDMVENPEQSRGSERLREVALPIVNNTKCKTIMPHIFTSSICAGHESGGKDSCQGDSGGPLMCRKAGEGWKLAGVVSWGSGCARPNTYGVYTRISNFLNWIDQQRSAH